MVHHALPDAPAPHSSHYLSVLDEAKERPTQPLSSTALHRATPQTQDHRSRLIGASRWIVIEHLGKIGSRQNPSSFSRSAFFLSNCLCSAWLCSENAPFTFWPAFSNARPDSPIRFFTCATLSFAFGDPANS